LAANRNAFILFSCDVGAAFSKGLTFAEVSQMTGEPLRTVQVDLPAGTVRLARTFKELSDYDPVIHCLEMVRPGFGLKDAPRLWNMRVKQLMDKLKMTATVSDAQLFCSWCESRLRVPQSLENGTEKELATNQEALNNLQMAVSTHVDDFKGAATEKVADAFMDVLEAEFGKLTRQKRNFEHCGIMHAQLADAVTCTQDHYVKQLRLIPMEHSSSLEDDVPEEVKYAFLVTSWWSSLGGHDTWRYCCLHWVPSTKSAGTEVEAHQTFERTGSLDEEKTFIVDLQASSDTLADYRFP